MREFIEDAAAARRDRFGELASFASRRDAMQIVAIRDRPATGDWPFRRPTTDPSVLAESTGRVVPVAAAAQGHSAAMRQRRGRVDIHLLSIGHGTLDAAAFNTHLRAADVKSAADVRRFPGSRTNPQFGADALAASLSAAGIEYRTMPELGGRRSATPGSPNTALRNASFRGYADFMQTPEFDLALTDLLMLAHDRPTAMFCAETLWWRCHRRLIADAIVLLHGGSVTHLVGAMKAAHVLTPGVRRDGTRLVYDNGVHQLG